ncbi:MAG TPA: hypothetical protein VIT43_00850 [Candidatus Dormibacteraeota bacterium]
MNLVADRRGLKLTAVTASGAAYRCDLRLPVPAGTVPIRLRHGVANLSIRRPGGVPVRAMLRDGAASLQFDEQLIGPTLGQEPFESAGYGDATNRYDVEVIRGAAKLMIAKD